MSSTHYEVLGVARTASTDEIRRAHRDAVRRLHPDVSDSSERRRDELQRVNDAWAVLGVEGRRRSYDARLGSGSQDATRVRTAAPPNRADHDDALGLTSSRGVAVALRVVPMLLLLGGLAAIFVVTAYAVRPVREPSVTSPGDPPGGSTSSDPGGVGRPQELSTDDLPSECALIDRQNNAMLGACSAPGSRRIVEIVDPNEGCPAGTETMRDSNLLNRSFCLEN